MKSQMIVVMLLAGLASSLWAQLEIRDASREPLENYTESSYWIGDEERPIYLSPEILMSSADVEDAYVSKQGDHYAVNLEFFDPAAQRFRQITAARIRQELVFLVDGKVFTVATVMNPLSKRAMIVGTLTRSEAEQLARTILNRPAASELSQ
ncbi:hypothetical protein QEH52_10625 [Coraliomargarita sp. SDUM461003]|uniref:SecDF P1 head subdomain domain-containing protein n=1 Tax=Thalassobacterium maritimum TaxID=3041265 RepID=A0ABU1AV60_9BACT|nr:hypothetical protein [Coraliomargarita sp. SDUM461003]MDQ8207966.1 hypothetical protein [Coraliomargarita sp. SDUM461003]